MEYLGHDLSGHCCYSCRAFFRRTVQRVRKKGLKRCRTGGQDCEVTPATKTCIHCRYTRYCTVMYCIVLHCTVMHCIHCNHPRCLAIGMEPALLQGRRAQQERDTEVTGDADKGEHGGSDDVSKDGDGDTLPVKTEETVTTDVDIVNLLPPASPDTSISKAKTEPQFEEEEDDTKPVSVMAMVGPYMSLTVEEQKLLDKLVSDTQVCTISTQIYLQYLQYLHIYIYNIYTDIYCSGGGAELLPGVAAPGPGPRLPGHPDPRGDGRPGDRLQTGAELLPPQHHVRAPVLQRPHSQVSILQE